MLPNATLVMKQHIGSRFNFHIVSTIQADLFIPRILIDLIS